MSSLPEKNISCFQDSGRSYYTEFVRQTPADTVVLTLACGKYRFHDLDLGTAAGLPRLMDVGKCSDAYSAIRIAIALADAFGCGVNDLPLSVVLSWYEQKAVCILLMLLHLDIRNLRFGPTLRAFLSPGVLQYLVEPFSNARSRVHFLYLLLLPNLCHRAIMKKTAPGGGVQREKHNQNGWPALRGQAE